MSVFNGLFLETLNTELVAGSEEPIYLPASEDYPHHRILFAHGYFASALHEIAHWCVAGPKRRELEDFGYWYQPDGRSFAEQQEFERVEVKPQAYEWILSAACGKKFNFSADNLASGAVVSASFKNAVFEQVQRSLEQGLPTRLDQLSNSLVRFYNQPELSIERLRLVGPPL